MFQAGLKGRRGGLEMYKVIKYYSSPQEGSCVAMGIMSSLDSLVGSMLRNPSGPFTVVEQALYLGCNPVPCLLLAFPEPPLIVSVCQKLSSVPPPHVVPAPDTELTPDSLTLLCHGLLGPPCHCTHKERSASTQETEGPSHRK